MTTSLKISEYLKLIVASNSPMIMAYNIIGAGNITTDVDEQIKIVKNNPDDYFDLKYPTYEAFIELLKVNPLFMDKGDFAKDPRFIEFVCREMKLINSEIFYRDINPYYEMMNDEQKVFFVMRTGFKYPATSP